MYEANLASEDSRKRTQSGEVICFAWLDPLVLKKTPGPAVPFSPLLEMPSGQWWVRVLVAMRAAVLLRLPSSDDLGKQYSLILLIHIDLYSLALSTKDLRKLTTKTIQLNIESRKSNAVRNIFPEPFFPPMASFTVLCEQNENHHDRLSALEEATVGFKQENIKSAGECV